MINQLSREELVFALKLSDRLDRYDEVLQIIKLLSMHDEQLSDEEFKLFYISISPYLYPKRQSIEQLKQVNLEDKRESDQKFIQNFINNQNFIIIRECEEIIQIVERFQIKKDITDLQKYLCFTIKGDCYRYITENDYGNTHAADDALQAYLQGEEVLSRLKNLDFKNRYQLNTKICMLFKLIGDSTKALSLYQQIIEEFIKQSQIPDLKLNDNNTKKFIQNIIDNIQLILQQNNISEQNYQDYTDLNYLFE
ncbi:hypothetical protein ABPG74_011425 [Tetrahymena malaccensis]